MKQSLIIILLIIVFLMGIATSCSKSKNYLNRNSGTWEIASMQIDYLNANGGIDSSRSTEITGFFMFYDTPTTGDDPYFLASNGRTIKGLEHHSAHFYRSDGSIITMVSSIGQLVPDRNFAITKNAKNSMTLDYTGPAMNFYANYFGKVKEHIVLNRIKF